MASMRDLIMQGELENRASTGGRIASFLESALSGYSSGRELATKDAAGRLERTIKLLDMQKKQQDMETDAMNRKITMNLFKRAGLLDLDDNESTMARSVGLDNITDTKPPKQHTTQGRLASFYVGDREFAFMPSVSTTKGAGFDLKELTKDKDKDSDKDPYTRQAKILDLAGEAAKREKEKMLISLGIDPKQAGDLSVVSEDEVQKYIPEITAFLEDKPDQAKGIRGKRLQQQGYIEQHMKSIQQQIEELRKAESDYVPFNEKPKKVEKLTTRRNRLIQGGGTQEIRAQLIEDINELKQDPKANREQIVKLTKELLQLSRR